MSNHQPDYNHDEQPAEADRQTSRDTTPDRYEPDFSRLRLARASLDNAFPQG